MSRASSIRSLLFAPGNDARKLKKALESDADAVVADLEDAVPAPEKGRAREIVRDLVAGARPETLLAVRLNAVGTAFWEDDLRMLSELPPDALVLPKATPDGVAALGPDGPPVIGIAETAQGLRLAYETACSPRTVALLLGAVDLGLELGLEPRADGQEVLFARSKLVVDSAAAGIRGPLDLVHVDLHDDEGLEAECRLARSLGLRGKACIHPAQVAIVNRVFSPSDEETDRARRVVQAYEEGRAEGRGAVSLDGEMIDLPVVERARQVLAASERSPSDDH
ncbi:MAG TPA: CoA ester lyase [Gaiellaceae bacterium]|nr:CoA ester lyase [Gaiellaceae bacterium]